MDRNEKLKELFLSESFKKEAENLKTAEELQELFCKHGLEMTVEEVVDLCGKIARQMEAGENGEISEDALEDVTGGIAWALVGLGVLCVGAVALGIYNGYQETKRKK